MAAASDRQIRQSSLAKRQAILDAATELFFEVGYGNASMNQIVAKVGGSKGTIYAWFSNKETLFRAVLDKEMEEHFSPLLKTRMAESEMREGLIFIARRMLEVTSSQRGVALMRLVIAEAGRFPEIGRLLFDHIQAPLSKIIQDYLKEKNAGARLQDLSVSKAVEYFFGMLVHRTFMERMLMPDKPFGDRAIRQKAVRTVDDFIAMVGLDAAGMKGEAIG